MGEIAKPRIRNRDGEKKRAIKRKRPYHAPDPKTFFFSKETMGSGVSLKMVGGRIVGGT